LCRAVYAFPAAIVMLNPTLREGEMILIKKSKPLQEKNKETHPMFQYPVK
jgi:hypothetical protein